MRYFSADGPTDEPTDKAILGVGLGVLVRSVNFPTSGPEEQRRFALVV